MKKGSNRGSVGTAIPKYLSIAAIVVSSILFVHDRAQIYRVEKEKESLKELAKNRALDISANINVLDGRVRSWMQEHELAKYSNLSRSELRKVHWTAEAGGMIQEMRRAASGEESSEATGARLEPIKPLPGEKCVWRGCEHSTQLTDKLLKTLEEEKKKRFQAAASGKAPPPTGGGSVGDLEARMPDRVRKSGPTTDFSGSHSILALPQEKFDSTPLNSLVEGIYGPPTHGASDGGKSCDGDFGIELMQRWRSLRADFCSPLGDPPPAPPSTPSNRVSGSRVDCYVIQQTGHSGSDNMCDLRNVVVDMSPYSNKDLMKKTMEDYKKTKHEDQAYPHFAQPVIKGHCRVQGDKFGNEKVFPGWNKDWVYHGFRSVEQAGSGELQCDVWEETPSILLERDTFANMYHDTEDFWNVFLAMGILQLPRNNVQILLADLYPWGPFKSMWTEAFGARAPLTAWEMREKYGTKKVCFRQLVMGIYGPASSLTIMKKETKCVGSPLVRAFSDFVIRGLAMQAYTHPALERPPSSVLVNYMARRSSVMWPERAFCDDRFFVCAEWSHLENRKLGRVVKNDKEVVAALSEMQRQSFDGGRSMVFVDMDYNLLSFQDQLKTDCMTDVMIGPHGAGLTHQMFMPDRAILIELFVDNSGANKHFHNMARWRGRGGKQYRPVSTQNPVSIDKIKEIVRDAVNSIEIDKY